MGKAILEFCGIFKVIKLYSNRSGVSWKSVSLVLLLLGIQVKNEYVWTRNEHFSFLFTMFRDFLTCKTLKWFVALCR